MHMYVVSIYTYTYFFGVPSLLDMPVQVLTKVHVDQFGLILIGFTFPRWSITI